MENALVSASGASDLQPWREAVHAVECGAVKERVRGGDGAHRAAAPPAVTGACGPRSASAACRPRPGQHRTRRRPRRASRNPTLPSAPRAQQRRPEGICTYFSDRKGFLDFLGIVLTGLFSTSSPFSSSDPSVFSLKIKHFCDSDVSTAFWVSSCFLN